MRTPDQSRLVTVPAETNERMYLISVPLITPVTLSSLSVDVSSEESVPAVSTWISVTAKMFVEMRQMQAVNTNLQVFKK